MSEIGAMIIKFQADTAQLRTDLNKVKSDLGSTADGAREAGETMDKSFAEGRGGLMLTEDLIGVRLPRHLNSLIAQIPGVGAAFAAMLPIAGALVFVKIIGELIEKHEALAKAINKATLEADNMAVKEADTTKQLTLTNLKLDDQIAKLQKKPSHNYIKEAILETSDALDKMAASYAADFQKMNDMIIEQTGFWASLKRGIGDAWSGVGQGKGYGTTTEALHKVQDAMMKVEEARRKMAEAPIDKASQTAVQKELVTALQNQLRAIDAASPALKGHEELIIQMGSVATATATEIKNLNQVVESGQKKAVVGALEEQKEEDEIYKKMMDGLEKRMEIERRAAKERAEAKKKAAAEAEKEAELLTAANEAFIKSMRAVAKVKADMAALDNENRAHSKVDDDKTQMDDLERTYKLGLISASAYFAQKHDLIVKAEKDELDYLAIREQAAKADFVLAQQGNDLQAQLTAKRQLVAAQNALTDATRRYNKELRDTDADARKMAGNWKMYFMQMKVETQDLSQQIRVTLQGSITQFTRAFGDDMARCIVENKSLGQAVRQEAAHMLESMLSMLIQWLEKWVITHALAKVVQTSTDMSGKATAASLAGANMTASWAAAPWPIDALAPAMGAQAFAAAMSFEVGGKIPGDGPVPIVGHGGETVVTRALTDRVEAAEGRGVANTITHGDTHVHATYAPQINAIDSNGVEGMLKTHHRTFQRELERQIRRMNK